MADVPLMNNPMTTSGDIIYGGASGAPTRLAKGTDGDVLTLASGIPSWAAAAGGGGGTPIRLTTDQVYNAQAALQNVTDLVLALGASEVWEFIGQMWYDSATAADIKIAFTVPSGATLWWARHGASDTGDTVLGNGVITGSGTAGGFSGGGVGTLRSVHINGLVTNGATPGNLQLQACQATSTASNTTLHANSTLRAWQLV